jgi:hypothetical protein
MASTLARSMPLGALIVHSGLVCGQSACQLADTLVEAVPTATMAVKESAALSVSPPQHNLLTVTDPYGT